MSRDNGITDTVARVAFWITLALAIFLIGGEFAKRNWQPYKFFNDGYNAAKLLLNQAPKRRPGLLEKLRYEGRDVTINDPVRAYPGITALQGVFAEGAEIRLIDMDGRIIHRWNVDFSSIWPNPEHVFPRSRIPATRFNFDIQGMWLLPDGSVILNFSELGTAKLDKCGNTQWTLDRMTHHSITPTSNGSYWIPAKNDPRNVSDDLLLYGLANEKLSEKHEGASYEDLILLVDADGWIKKEISVLRALVESQLEPQLRDIGLIDLFDPTHVNDIEVVTRALAEQIPAVREGDLLISLRELHMLAILDSDSGVLKWHQIGPWMRQHDPDVTNEGNIEVFNNRDGYQNLATRSRQNPGSNIMSLAPSTGQIKIIYPKSEDKTFYTKIMGTHQILPNGNRLITESMAGRVFEVDEQGGIVWEYISPYDEEYAALLADAIRYDKEYFKISDWSCH